VEEGSGPLVLLVHGFPESWYSWRHQLPVIAEAGFRAVAIDVRGYGRSSAPLAVEAYGMLQHVSDNLGVVEALAGRGSPAIIIGHDWGAPIAAHSALLRPDIFTAVAMLSVPYRPPGGRRPTEAFAELGRQAGHDEEFYISYFQEPGRAEREAEIDVRSWLLLRRGVSRRGEFGVRRRDHRHRMVLHGRNADSGRCQLFTALVRRGDNHPFRPGSPRMSDG
jgi:pimeloyl-ACP methyl ester carboxylesterase